MSEWIKTANIKPDDSSPTVLYAAPDDWDGEWYVETTYWENVCKYPKDYPYWMPMPKPPVPDKPVDRGQEQ